MEKFTYILWFVRVDDFNGLYFVPDLVDIPNEKRLCLNWFVEQNTLRKFQSKIKFFLALLLFYTSNALGMISFFALAPKWPGLMKQWEIIEQRVPTFRNNRQRFKRVIEIRLFAFAIFILFIGEKVKFQQFHWGLNVNYYLSLFQLRVLLVYTPSSSIRKKYDLKKIHFRMYFDQKDHLVISPKSLYGLQSAPSTST